MYTAFLNQHSRMIVVPPPPKFGRSRARFGRKLTKLAESGPILVEIGPRSRHWPSSVQRRSKSARIWSLPGLFELAPNCGTVDSNSTDIDRLRPPLGRGRPRLGQHRKMSTGFGLILATLACDALPGTLLGQRSSAPPASGTADLYNTLGARV